MTDKLIERLRYEADGAEFSNRYADLVGEAADHIETLQAEKAVMLEALEESRQVIVDGFRAIVRNMPEDKMAGIKKIDAAIAKAKGETA